MPYFLFLFLCIVWGSNFILMARASDAMGPVTIGIGRLFGGAIVLAFLWWFRKSTYRFSIRDGWHIGFVALIATALPFVIQPYLISQGFGHSYFGTMVALVPLATILVSVPILGILPTRRQLVGVLGGLFCMTFILQDGSDRGMSVGMLALAVVVPVVYAWGNTHIKWKLQHVPVLPQTTLLLGVAGAMLLPVELIPQVRDSLDLAGPASPHDWPIAIGALAFLGVVGTGFSVLVFVHLIVYQGPLFAGMVTYVVPILALCWGSFDSETITPRQMAAMGGVLAMVALVQFGAARPTLSSAEA